MHYNDTFGTLSFMLTLSAKKELMIFCNGRREEKHSKLCRGSKRKYDFLLQGCEHLPGRECSNALLYCWGSPGVSWWTTIELNSQHKTGEFPRRNSPPESPTRDWRSSLSFLLYTVSFRYFVLLLCCTYRRNQIFCFIVVPYKCLDVWVQCSLRRWDVRF